MDVSILFELEYLDLSNFKTSNVTDMSYMFNECHKLKEIKGINTLKTIKVTNMKGMFQSCSELERLDLSNFNTSNVTAMSYMFKDCNKILYLNLSNFSTNCKKEEMLSFTHNCEFLASNKSLLDLYNLSK